MTANRPPQAGPPRELVATPPAPPVRGDGGVVSSTARLGLGTGEHDVGGWLSVLRMPPLFVLLCAGTAMAVACLVFLLLPLRMDRHPPSNSFDLAGALGGNLAGLVRFVAIVVMLFALYVVAALAAVRAGRAGAAAAMGFAGLFMLLILPAHPVYSRDIFHYAATARVLYLYGANPFVVPPSAFPADQIAHLADWRWLPTPYGPIWTLLSAAPYYALDGSDDPALNVMAFKGLAAACALLTAWVIGCTAERFRPGSRAVAIVLFAWNPLVLLHLVGDGHNDAAMLLLLVLGLHLAVRGRTGWAAWALAGSVLIKFVSLLVLPLVIAWLLRSERPGRRREAILLALAAPVLAVVAYLPVWEGPRTLAASLDEGTYVTTSLPALALPLLQRAVSTDTALWCLTTGVRVAFLPVLAVLAWRRGRGDGARLITLAAGAYSLFLVLATPWFMPWYALWPLAPAAAVPHRRRVVLPVVALSFGASLLPVATAFLAPMLRQGDDWPYMHLVAVCLAFGPAALTVVALRARPLLAAQRMRR